VISGHANQARIRSFDPKDTANVRCSKDVVSFAREKGFFKGEDKDFSFADTYAPLSFGGLRACEARVWSLFRRAAPSLNLGHEYVRPELGLKRLPLWIKPDRKLDVRDAMELMRDHYEGTDFDMTKDVGAGPFALPYRWRPMGFKVEGQDYVHERAISTQQTGYSFVTQSRAWLPSDIGGVLWFGVDDTYTTVYTPVYCGIQEPPKAFAEGNGNFESFSWDSAFWVFSFVTNWTYTKWSEMIVDVQKVQREFEGRYAAEQPDLERTALELHKQDPGRAREFLTRQVSRNSEELLARWRKLGEFLMWKYMDGNVRDEKGKVTHPRYPESWYRKIVQDKGEVLKVRKIEGMAKDEG
jgi:dipeptidase